MQPQFSYAVSKRSHAVTQGLKYWRAYELSPSGAEHVRTIADNFPAFQLSSETARNSKDLWSGSYDHIDAFVERNGFMTGHYLFSGERTLAVE